MRILEVSRIHADLQPIARLTLSAERIPALTFTAYDDELGHGVQAFVQLAQGTFRLWTTSTGSTALERRVRLRR